MFQTFTDPARRVVVLAQGEAMRLNHEYLDTEHLLLGLLHEPGDLALTTLDSLGIPPDIVRLRVEELVGAGPEPVEFISHFTPRTKKALELSLRESRQLGAGEIATEHILLGLLHEGSGIAGMVLTKLGVDLETARRAVANLYAEAAPNGKPQRGAAADPTAEADAEEGPGATEPNGTEPNGTVHPQAGAEPDGDDAAPPEAWPEEEADGTHG